MTQHRPPVHHEPDCENPDGCEYPDPHEHGFDCDKTCTECRGKCHPVCPANSEYPIIGHHF